MKKPDFVKEYEDFESIPDSMKEEVGLSPTWMSRLFSSNIRIGRYFCIEPGPITPLSPQKFPQYVPFVFYQFQNGRTFLTIGSQSYPSIHSALTLVSSKKLKKWMLQEFL